MPIAPGDGMVGALGAAPAPTLAPGGALMGPVPSAGPMVVLLPVPHCVTTLLFASVTRVHGSPCGPVNLSTFCACTAVHKVSSATVTMNVFISVSPTKLSRCAEYCIGTLRHG